ncbi:MAG: protein YgfX [Gallionellaceae bacterium]
MIQDIKFKPSRYLAALLIAAHLVAIIALVPLALPIWARMGLMLVLVVNFSYLLRRNILLNLPSSCVGLSLGKEGVGMLARNGEQLQCKVLHDSLVTPVITVINVLPQGARFARAAVILPDGLDAESFRQLRVWLKWGG